MSWEWDSTISFLAIWTLKLVKWTSGAHGVTSCALESGVKVWQRLHSISWRLHPPISRSHRDASSELIAIKLIVFSCALLSCATHRIFLAEVEMSPAIYHKPQSRTAFSINCFAQKQALPRPFFFFCWTERRVRLAISSELRAKTGCGPGPTGSVNYQQARTHIQTLLWNPYLANLSHHNPSVQIRWHRPVIH